MSELENKLLAFLDEWEKDFGVYAPQGVVDIIREIIKVCEINESLYKDLPVTCWIGFGNGVNNVTRLVMSPSRPKDINSVEFFKGPFYLDLGK